MAFEVIGGHVWDVGRGNDIEDPPRVFPSEESHQDDQPELKVSRKVIRKVIRSGATEFRYERSVQPMPKIGPWRNQLDGLLLSNEGKPRRERLTHIRIFEELRGLGYEGSYDAVPRYAGSGRRSGVRQRPKPMCR